MEVNMRNKILILMFAALVTGGSIAQASPLPQASSTPAATVPQRPWRRCRGARWGAAPIAHRDDRKNRQQLVGWGRQHSHRQQRPDLDTGNAFARQCTHDLGVHSRARVVHPRTHLARHLYIVVCAGARLGQRRTDVHAPSSIRSL